MKLKELLQNPEKMSVMVESSSETDLEFVDLCEKRLAYIDKYSTPKYLMDNLYVFKMVIPLWGHLKCSEIKTEMIEKYIFARAQKSHYGANYDLRILKATFKFGKSSGRKWIKHDPSADIRFLPVEKTVKYIPSVKDIARVIQAAEPEEQDCITVIKETIGRMGEINNLKWDDVNFQGRYVVLYTRKKKNGDLTARKIPMTKRLYETLLRRWKARDSDTTYVFVNPITNTKYVERKRLMKKLCKKTNVKYFRYHALRHYDASFLDHKKAPRTDIQQLLGHEKATTTDIYLHSLEGSLKKTVRLMDDF